MADFFYGVIEGFYGRQWTWRERADYAGFLSEYGFDAYIFAPKGEAALRSEWRKGLPSALVENLQALAETYHQSQVRWGLGLSPLGLAEDFSDSDRQALRGIIGQINALAPDILCILFDDMRGDIPALAARQSDVVEEILSCSEVNHHIVCPTYYSFDPVLPEVFGPMPERYLEELGEGLPDGVDIFWTGDRVISEAYTEASLAPVTQLFRRQPVLWDNYPVNDGRVTSNYLHLRPYTGRPGTLSQCANGHLVNPMNQPYLSRLVLQSLQLIYRAPDVYDADRAWEEALVTLADDAFSNRLREDAHRFQHEGLTGFTEEDKTALIAIYSAFDHPAAAEVVDWLSGAYVFDPACLTG